MRIPACLFWILMISLSPAVAGPVPAGGIELVTTRYPATARAGNGGSAIQVPVTGQDFAQATRVTVTTAMPDQPWSAQLAAPLTAGSVRSGDKLLVVYMARCVAGGNGRATAKVQLKKPSYAMVGMTASAKFGPGWEQVHQPFVAMLDVPEDGGEVVIFLGDQVQTVEIAGIRVLNYGDATGTVTWRGFKGTYRLSGGTTTAPFHPGRPGAPAKVEVP